MPCWASGSSLVLQQRSLIQCFKKLSGRMWLFSFYAKSLNASHSLSHRMRLACKMTVMLFTIKHLLPLFSVFPFHPFTSDLFLFISFYLLSLIHIHAILMTMENEMNRKGLKSEQKWKTDQQKESAEYRVRRVHRESEMSLGSIHVRDINYVKLCFHSVWN